MNQMTAVEVVDPSDRYTVSGTGYGLEGRIHHAAGHVRVDRGRDPAVRRRQRRQAGRRQGRRRPDRGRSAGAGRTRPGGHRRHPRALPTARHPALRPDLQADGHFPLAVDADGPAGGAVFCERRGTGGDGPRGHRSVRRAASHGTPRCRQRAQRARGAAGAGGPPGDGRRRSATWTRPTFDPTAICSATSPISR